MLDSDKCGENTWYKFGHQQSIMDSIDYAWASLKLSVVQCPVYLSVCLSLRLAVRLYVHLSVCRSMYVDVCMSVYLCSPIYLSVCLSVRPSVYNHFQSNHFLSSKWRRRSTRLAKTRMTTRISVVCQRCKLPAQSITGIGS